MTPSSPSSPMSVRWYLASQNDGLFIINDAPRPSNDDQWHDGPHGPSISLNVTELPEAKAIKIVGVLNDLAAPTTPTDGDEIEALARALEVQLHSHSPLFLTGTTVREIIAALRQSSAAIAEAQDTAGAYAMRMEAADAECKRAEARLAEAVEVLKVIEREHAWPAADYARNAVKRLVGGT